MKPILGGLAMPCSVFNYTFDGETRVGRNLDWIESSRGWVSFMQPADGGYGTMFFGDGFESGDLRAWSAPTAQLESAEIAPFADQQPPVSACPPCRLAPP